METIPQTSTYERFGNDLVLFADTKFDESLIVKGNIICRNGSHSLTMYGEIKAKNIDVSNIYAHGINADNINAGDINARDINTRDIIAGNINVKTNIDAHDIYAHDIKAKNISARNIEAYSIICEKRLKKTPKSRTFTKLFAQNRSKLKFKEQMPTSTD